MPVTACFHLHVLHMPPVGDIFEGMSNMKLIGGSHPVHIYRFRKYFRTSSNMLCKHCSDHCITLQDNFSFDIM